MRRITAVVGRAAFAVGIGGFGVLCLGFVDTVHNLEPLDLFVSTSSPAYVAVAILSGLFLLTASVSVATDAGAPTLPLVLAAIFISWIVALQFPSAVVFPALLRSPWWIRTFEVLSLAGGALVLAGLTISPRRRDWIRMGSLFYGISLPVFGALHVIYPGSVAALVPAFYPWPLFLAYLTGAAKIVGGLAIVSGLFPRAAAMCAGVLFGTYVLTLHIPRAITIHGPQLTSADDAVQLAARAGLTSLCVAIGMWGAAWIVADGLAVLKDAVPSGADRGPYSFALQKTGGPS